MVIRFAASIYFLFRLAGLTFYKYPIELTYFLYSIIMIFAFLCGAVFSPNTKSKIWVITLACYVLGLVLTVPYFIYELKIIHTDTSAFQSAILRGGELVVLTVLSFLLIKAKIGHFQNRQLKT